MKPPPFAYLRAGGLDDAIQALAAHGEDAKVLAGGQSLVPMLNFRLARPSVLVDVTRIGELGRLERENGTLIVGAAVRQAAAEISPLVADSCPLLLQALRYVGHPQIRARGTIGGSIAHADAAAELGAVALALDADIVAEGPNGRRRIAAREFFQGPWTTALDFDEVLVEVRIPVRPLKTTFLEEARRHGDFALVGVAAAVQLDPATGALTDVRLAATGVGASPLRLSEVERLLVGAVLDDDTFTAAGHAAAGEVEPPNDAKADSAYRRHLLGVLVGRALREVCA